MVLFLCANVRGGDSGSAELAGKLANLGVVYYEQGRYQSAAVALSQALRDFERSGLTAGSDYAATLGDLGSALRSLARYGEAEALYRQELSVREKQGGADEAGTATALYNLALLYDDTARYDGAIELASRAFEIRQRLFGEKSPPAADALNLLGSIALARGSSREAADLFRRALDIRENAMPHDDLKLAETLINAGIADRLLGDLAGAQTALEEALSRLAKTKPGNPSMGAALNALAMVAHARGDNQKAQELLGRALSVWAVNPGTGHPDYASALTNLGAVDQDAGQPKEARKLYLQALSIDQAKLVPAHPRIENDLNNLASVSIQLHDKKAAESYLRESLEAHRVSGRPDTVQEGFALAELGVLYARRKRREEATEAFRRATAILGASNAKLDPAFAGVLEAYSRTLRESASYAEAEEAEVRAMSIRVKNALRQDGGQ